MVNETNHIPLNAEWSGCYLTELEKVAIAALALETTSPDAISDLTGADIRWVPTLLEYLDQAEWDLSKALGLTALNHEHNAADNRAAYPILSKKGIIQ